MNNRWKSLLILSGVALFLAAIPVRAQEVSSENDKPKTASEAVLASWNDIGGRVVAMAQDWPEDKYNFRPNDKVRTFADVLRHIAGSNYVLINHVSGKKMGDDANDPSAEKFKSKAQIVAFLKKSVEDGASLIKSGGDAGVLKHLDYWIGYTEHMGEHYGQLVVYYRINGVVPPESRPKK
jgi:uncharacterized damage-inducible protein DinB